MQSSNFERGILLGDYILSKEIISVYPSLIWPNIWWVVGSKIEIFDWIFTPLSECLA